jgi:endonuclease G
MNGKTYRNYSFGWSNENYLAVWVAYPLCKMYTNGSNSGGDWEANPLFSSDYQPNFTKSFGFSQGYERGHQIANADRKCCYEANQQTYYFTNATLQHKDFNGPVWGVLEGNMRGAANSADTLYVVTGYVLPKSPRYITDYDGHKVPIPSGYFKAALRYHKASTQSVWMGAAFYLDHDASKYSSKQITKSESMSIAELEDKLGMDFFVNLPAMVGADKAATIENQDPDTFSSVWGIR